jgi:homocysteine S-methyltransferase
VAELWRLLDEHQVVLTEGAVIERLNRNPAVKLDPFVANAALALDPAGRTELVRLYQEYVAAGSDAGLPILLFTPTWRASAERVEQAGRSLDLNQVGADLLIGLRQQAGTYRHSMLVGGLLGPKGDAYRASAALPADAAYHYHLPQAQALALAGVDVLVAATLPALSEAIGLARAMGEQALPYLLSFVIRPNGTLLDGTLLGAAMRKVSATVRPPPFGYLVNCVHPANFGAAVVHLRSMPDERPHLLGLQGNASRRSQSELDGSAATESGDPEEFGLLMAELAHDPGLRILGGCCGTDGRHIRAIAAALARLGPR